MHLLKQTNSEVTAVRITSALIYINIYIYYILCNVMDELLTG